jgi:putative YphP/YqiW family bacilliredoxin
MPYPEILIKPMLDELTQLGVQETRTPEEVDAAVNSPGTVMVVVNSVCGCAAGKARPGIAMALKNAALPDKVVTVFGRSPA